MDRWHSLRQYTQARIAQGRVGCGIPTAALLDFQLAHAEARDAVLQSWNPTDVQGGLSQLSLDSVILNTQATSREQYLRNPDLGRALDAPSRAALERRHHPIGDVALLMTNGLSSTAVNRHGLALLQVIADRLTNHHLSHGPIYLIPNGRVAVADEVGELLRARLAIVVVGERPGLSAADSLGIYLTYNPRVGRMDAERNCISNIRPPEGLGYEDAATKLAYLADKALGLRFSGVRLKDDMPPAALLEDALDRRPPTPMAIS